MSNTGTPERLAPAAEASAEGQTLWQEVRSSALLFLLALTVTAGVAGLLHVAVGTLS